MILSAIMMVAMMCFSTQVNAQECNVKSNQKECGKKKAAEGKECAKATAGEHKCAKEAAGEHKCTKAAAGEHKCAKEAAGEHKCAKEAAGEHKCAKEAAAKKDCCKKGAKGKDCKKCTECKPECGDNNCKTCPNNHKCQKNCKK